MSYFKNKKILVIGGSGFIGSNLSIELMEIGSKVSILDQVSPSRLKKFKNNIDFIVQPTLSEEFLENLFNDYQIIFNFASIKKNKSFHSKYPAEILNKNTLLNFKVLDAFVESSANKLLVMSTSAVDSIQQNIFDTKMVTGHFGYAWSKRITEVSALAYAKQYNKSIYIARSDSVFGERDDFYNFPQVIPSLIKKISDGNSTITLLGNGKQTRNFLYVKDLISGLLTLLESGPMNEVIEFYGKREVSIKETAETIMNLLGSNSKIEFNGLDNDFSDIRNKKISAYTKINFEPKTEFMEALSNTIDWYKSQNEKDK